MSVVVSAFYRFVAIDDPQGLAEHLRRELSRCGIRGTVIVATEGINGTISGAPAAISQVFAGLREDPRFAPLTTKDAAAPEHPFARLKVKVKPEIVTFRQPAADPNVQVGTYVAPEAWNDLIRAPDVLVIDTRNSFEVALGTFEGAIDPGTQRFTDFPDFVARELDGQRHRRIAMFCTGGIRCEKATSYLLALGFEHVFHLDGGILNYLARVPAERSLWRGECFVFDERVTSDPGIEENDGSENEDPKPKAVA